jgi:hypothetical protein
MVQKQGFLVLPRQRDRMEACVSQPEHPDGGVALHAQSGVRATRPRLLRGSGARRARGSTDSGVAPFRPVRSMPSTRSYETRPRPRRSPPAPSPCILRTSSTGMEGLRPLGRRGSRPRMPPDRRHVGDGLAPEIRRRAARRRVRERPRIAGAQSLPRCALRPTRFATAETILATGGGGTRDTHPYRGVSRRASRPQGGRRQTRQCRACRARRGC